MPFLRRVLELEFLELLELVVPVSVSGTNGGSPYSEIEAMVCFQEKAAIDPKCCKPGLYRR